MSQLQSHSQLGADRWVLEKCPAGYKGFFADVGAADGFSISNTLLLEQQGWSGIAIDAFPRNFEARPNTVVEQAVVAAEGGELVNFVVPTHYRDFSGIERNLGKHRDALNQVETNRIVLQTQLLEDILKKHKAPSMIDYLNLDIEGSEFEVLRTFPFDKYRFRLITVEHNFEEPKRTMIHDLLAANGYVRDREVQWDDWYIKSNTNNEAE